MQLCHDDVDPNIGFHRRRSVIPGKPRLNMDKDIEILQISCGKQSALLCIITLQRLVEASLFRVHHIVPSRQNICIYHSHIGRALLEALSLHGLLHSLPGTNQLNPDKLILTYP